MNVEAIEPEAASSQAHLDLLEHGAELVPDDYTKIMCPFRIAISGPSQVKEQT